LQIIRISDARVCRPSFVAIEFMLDVDDIHESVIRGHYQNFLAFFDAPTGYPEHPRDILFSIGDQK
jgi:hypothetical protein